jgi:CRISPR-associated endonuclease Cas3-HD
MLITEIKGKSNEQLIVHSKKVCEYSIELSKRYDLDRKYLGIIEISSLLHDIGKCTKDFQRFLNEQESERKFTHNEIGWAFVSKHLKVREGLDLILDSIYWHHGFPYFKKYGEKITNSDVYGTIDDSDKEVMKKYIIEVLGKKFYVEDNEEREIITPPFYDFIDVKSKDVKKLLIRSILISADRMVSSFDGVYKNPIEHIPNLLSKEIIDKYNIPFDNDRFRLQQSIIPKLNGTSFVNAPAGFGKTLIGFLKNIQSNKKMIWVCPRNIVAEQVYRELKDLIDKFGVKLNLELFYTGEVKKSNWETEGFQSDIIVTNIDNFLSPSVNSNKMNDLYFINDCDVVFDEYHELISEGALFSCFVNIMNIRHKFTKSDTILLSATPYNISFLWDTPSKKSNFLPDKNKHYQPAHDKTYKFFFDEKDDVNLLNIEESGNNLIILNSIGNTQKVYRNLGKKILIHSEFLENDRLERTNLIYKLYDKHSDYKVVKEDVVSSLILQASMDISFKNLYESVLSPQTTVQRIGRTNRWGDYDESNVYVYNFTDRAERAVKHIHYTYDISKKWYMFLEENSKGKKLTLSEIYVTFNKFNEINDKLIKTFIEDKFKVSCELLTKIYPIKFFNKSKQKTDIKNSESNKLRLITQNIFFICKRTDKDEYTDVFNQQIYKTIGEDFHEKTNVLSDFKKTYRSLVDDSRFEFKEMLEKFDRLNIDVIRRMGKKSNTPYIRYDVRYDPELGLINVPK